MDRQKAEREYAELMERLGTVLVALHGRDKVQDMLDVVADDVQHSIDVACEDMEAQ